MIKIIPFYEKKLFSQFKQKYHHLYSEDAWKYIEENFGTFLHENMRPDILSQVYATMNIGNSPETYYQRNLNNILNQFDIGCKILEVGCGMLPAFAELLAEKQEQIGTGTITAIDPDLIITTSKHPTLSLKKDEFSADYDIKSYDLVISIMSCGTTEDIIVNSSKNNKDYYIAMCGCDHSNGGYYGYSTFYGEAGIKMYQQDMIQLAKELDDSDSITVDELTGLIDYPIISRRRK